jgi:hypothetical protein
LETSGTWCEDDFTLVDTGGGGDTTLIDELVTGVFVRDETFNQTTFGGVFTNTSGAYDILLPNVTRFRRTSYTFESSTFNSVSMPNYTGDAYTLFRSSKIPHISIDNLSSINENNAFDNCSIQKAFFPKAVIALNTNRNSAFNNCKSLTVAVIKAIGNTYYVFRGCTSLTAVDILDNTNNNMIDNAFQNSTVFDTLIIRAETMYPLMNTSAFNGTKFASGGAGGTLYVPSALISSYQTATNWSTILGYANNSIQAIEGSIYETQYADGTPIS